MPETYSKPCQISKMIRYFENPGIEQFDQEFSGIIEVYGAIFSHVQNSV